MTKSVLIIVCALCVIGVTSCTTTIVDTGPKWYPYGELEIYKQLGEGNVFLARGRSKESSGITIMNTAASRLEIDVKRLGDARLMTQGMLNVQADDVRLTAVENAGKMYTDPTTAPRREGRITYELPSYYRKIVINFYNVKFDGFIFEVTLTDDVLTDR